MTRILALSGSLGLSFESVLLDATRKLAPLGVEVVFYRELRRLPRFNSDWRDQEIAEVLFFQDKLRHADALLIATAEFAHGLPGELKNALYWGIRGGQVSGKPVGLFKTAQTDVVYKYLPAALKRMDVRLMEEAIVSIPAADTKTGVAEILGSLLYSPAIRQVLQVLADEVSLQREEMKKRWGKGASFLNVDHLDKTSPSCA